MSGFNWLVYRELNPDIINTTNENDPLFYTLHFKNNQKNKDLKWNIFQLYPDFDHKQYRLNYKDLQKMNKYNLEYHWIKYGNIEGRTYKKINHRNTFIDKNRINKIIFKKPIQICNNKYNKIVLIQEYFIPKDKNRLAEINKCLECNIANELIDEIHLFIEDQDLNKFNENTENKNLLFNTKVILVKSESRLTFNRAIKYANTLGENTVKIMSNNDISFDLSLAHLKNMDLTNTCLALTRYEILSYRPFLINLDSKNFYTPISIGSQDTWIFNKLEEDDRYNFYFGKPHCDTYFAYLLDKKGVKVIDNVRLIKTYHHHLTNIRYYTQKESVTNNPNEYKSIELC